MSMNRATGAITDRVRHILTELEDVRQDLLALSDDIWLSIDHNDNHAIEQGARFKRMFNVRFMELDSAVTAISALVQQFTDVHVDAPVSEPDEGRTRAESTRIIEQLDRRTPHTLDEDFEYKRPYGFSLGDHAYTDLFTWRGMYRTFCLDLASRDRERFRALPENPNFISSRGNKTFSRNPRDLRRAIELADGIYFETNLSANSLAQGMRALLREFGISAEEMKIYLREDRDSEDGE